MAFEDDKAAFMAKVKAFDCNLVYFVDTNFQSYADLVMVLISLLDRFECVPSFLTDLLSCIDGTELTTLKIYFNVTSGTATDPTFIVNSAIGTATLTITTTDSRMGKYVGECVIAGSSVVDKFVLADGTLGVLDVSGGAHLKVLETTGTAIINTLRVSGCNSVVSTVDVAASSALIDNEVTFGGGYFGGYSCLNAEAACAHDVSGLATSKITFNSITINWTPASETIRTVILYRLNNYLAWIDVDAANISTPIGNRIINGFVFRGLESDTYYDFKVINVCANGIKSGGALITAKTLSIAGGSGGSGSDGQRKVTYITTGSEGTTLPAIIPTGLPHEEVNVYMEGALLIESTMIAAGYRYDDSTGDIDFTTALSTDGGQNIVITY